MAFERKNRRGTKSYRIASLTIRPGVDREDPMVQRGCLSKSRFDRRKVAAAAAAGMRRKTGLPFSFYRCRSCGNFHLTTTTKRAA